MGYSWFPRRRATSFRIGDDDVSMTKPRRQLSAGPSTAGARRESKTRRPRFLGVRQAKWWIGCMPPSEVVFQGCCLLKNRSPTIGNNLKSPAGFSRTGLTVRNDLFQPRGGDADNQGAGARPARGRRAAGVTLSNNLEPGFGLLHRRLLHQRGCEAPPTGQVDHRRGRQRSEIYSEVLAKDGHRRKLARPAAIGVMMDGQVPSGPEGSRTGSVS